MDDEFNQNELSAEDLAILQAFDEMDLGGWEVERSEKGISERPLTDHEMGIEFLAPEELLAIFVSEAGEDIAAIRQTLQQLEPDDHLESARLQVLQRTAHKLKGSTGAMGCTAMSTIAHHIEELVKLITSGTIVPFIGLNALVQTVRALETTLNSLVTSGVESSDPLAELGAEYKALNIEIASGLAEKQALSTAVEEEQETAPRVYAPLRATVEAEPFSKAPQESHTTLHVVRVEVDRFEQLILHTEKLAELSSPLESAQAEVEKALQELQTAQARLRHLEVLVSAQLVAKASSATIEPNGNGERPTSSLIARILDEARQRTGQHYQRKSKVATRLVKKADSFQWDDLEIDRFTENDVLAHSLGEAIADVTTASAQLRAAFAQLSRITQQHIDQATNVRNDTLLLSLAPISTLVPRIERAIMMSALAQQHQVLFETEGETTEIDQEILEKVMQPLLQLVRTCTAGSQTATKTGAAERGNATDRIRLHVHTVDNEVNIEVGFSMTVAGGALDEVQEAIRRLNGTIVARRNNLGGISFHLRLPRSQGAIQGFLVAVGNRSVVVPLTQVQRIEPGKENRGELPYTLNSLLGFPMEKDLPESERAALILRTEERALSRHADA